MRQALWYLFYMELILLWRRSQEWLYPLGFFLILICLFPLAFTPDPVFLHSFIPGGVWIAALLASLLSIQTIYVNDWEEGYIEQCLLGQVPLPLCLLVKLAAQWIVTELPLILLVPLIGLLFHLSAAVTLAIIGSLVVGTPILLLIGSLIAALTVGLRQQGVLLGLLMLPLVTPVLIFGVSMTQQAAAGLSIAGPLAFLAGLALVAITLLPVAIAATLRIGVDD